METNVEFEDWSDAVDKLRPQIYGHYYRRTLKHMALVHKYMARIACLEPKMQGLVNRIPLHDVSKLEEPEIDPYALITWKYRCADVGEQFAIPEHIQSAMQAATTHHVTTNSHHPEFHCDRKENLINPIDRDKPPAAAVDATAMPELDIAEMVADWCAVAEERGNCPYAWFADNCGTRWIFTDEQISCVYDCMDAATHTCWEQKSWD